MNKKNTRPILSKTSKTDVRVRRCKIGEDISFQIECNDLKTTYKAYAYYKEHLKELKDIIDSDIIIALDTNLLLNLYKMSFKERSEFLRFINKNSNRIIITNQVEIEYLRHRVNYIQDLHRTLKEIKTNAKKSIDTLKKSCELATNQLSQFSKSKIVFNDIPLAKEHVEKIIKYIDENSFTNAYKEKLDELYAPLNDILEEGVNKLLSNAVYEIDDPVMASLGNIYILDKLSEEELAFIQELYNKLLETYDKKKTETTEKDNFTFPGCGDRKKIKEENNPCGDLTIYHELLSYMYTHKKDVVFLTRDVSKSDWIRDDGKPFNHYIVDIYRNTEHMLYICNAEKFIPLTFASIVDTDNHETDDDLLIDTKEENSNTQDQVKINDEKEEVEVEDVEINVPYLREITEERFIDELKTAQSWANEYGDKYVSKQYFIYKILGHKHFNYNTSLEVLAQLVTNGIVTEYTENRDGNEFTCIKLCPL